MKTLQYIISLICLLCLTGCKFDGSLRYEKYDLDESKSQKVSFNESWTYVEADIPSLEWIKICQNEGIVYVKLKGKAPRKYNFESPRYSIYCQNMEWGAIDSETGDYISGISIGVTPTTNDVKNILAATNNLGDKLSDAISKKNVILNSNDDNKWHHVLNVSMELNHLYEERAEQYLPMLKNVIPLERCCTMLIHIGNTQPFKRSTYEGWYVFPIKAHNLYWNPQFPPKKESYF